MRVAKFILTALVLVFMVAVYVSGATPSTPMDQLAQKLGQVESVQTLESEGSQQVLRYLSLYPEDVKELHYWKSSDGMNASELVVAEAADSSQMSTLKAAMEQRVEDQKTAFEGYAPEQEAKLNNYVLKTRGNYLFYAVGSSDELAAWEEVFDGIQ